MKPAAPVTSTVWPPGAVPGGGTAPSPVIATVVEQARPGTRVALAVIEGGFQRDHGSHGKGQSPQRVGRILPATPDGPATRPHGG